MIAVSFFEGAANAERSMHYAEIDFACAASAVAGLTFCSCGMMRARAQVQTTRVAYPVTIGGRRARTIDTRWLRRA